MEKQIIEEVIIFKFFLVFGYQYRDNGFIIILLN